MEKTLMSSNDTATTFENPYTLSSVNKTTAPAGTQGNDWYRYVVERDDSTIVGCMRGTLQQVTAYAKEFVENLNSRTKNRKNYSTWSPPNKKSAKPKAVKTEKTA
jgi:hypothetical protein